eukprot:2488088-Alexandrium_andersonii.AAC.1
MCIRDSHRTLRRARSSTTRPLATWLRGPSSRRRRRSSRSRAQRRYAPLTGRPCLQRRRLATSVAG